MRPKQSVDGSTYFVICRPNFEEGYLLDYHALGAECREKLQMIGYEAFDSRISAALDLFNFNGSCIIRRKILMAFLLSAHLKIASYFMWRLNMCEPFLSAISCDTC